MGAGRRCSRRSAPGQPLAARRASPSRPAWAWPSTTRPTPRWLPALVPESPAAGRQRLRGHGAPDHRAGRRPRRGRRGRRRGLARRRPSPSPPPASVARRSLALTQGAADARPPRRSTTSTRTHPVRAALHDMREGFVYMVRTPWLLATLLFASLMVLVMMGPLEVLIPFLVKDELGGGPADHALVLAAFGIGGALGSLVMASVRMPRRYLTLMNLGWGVGLPAVRSSSGCHRRSGSWWPAAFVIGRALLRPHGHLGHPAPAPGAAGTCSAGSPRSTSSSSVSPDAGVDGAGRPGRRR